MIKITLSTKLGELRWTQADLSRKTGIRPSTINEYYHDLAERINLDHFDKICEALDCELSEIIIRVPNTIPIIERNRTGHEIPRDDDSK
jgi:putative transcriptional regulator